MQGLGLQISLSELSLKLTWLETLENFSSVGSFFDGLMIEFITSWVSVFVRAGWNGMRWSSRFPFTNFLLLALCRLTFQSLVLLAI